MASPLPRKVPAWHQMVSPGRTAWPGRLTARSSCCVGPLSTEEKDRCCREASGLEPLLLVPTGYFPRGTAEVCAYMDQMFASGQIVVADTARRLARDVLRPPLPPLPPLVEAIAYPL